MGIELAVIPVALYFLVKWAMTGDNSTALAIWLQAIGTVGALFWLTWDFTWHRPHRRKKEIEEERKAWARSVGYRTSPHFTSTEPMMVEYDWHVLNAGRFPVSQAKLVYIDKIDDVWTVIATRYIGTLLPNIPIGPGEDRIVIPLESFSYDKEILEFVDIWDNRWHKTQKSLTEAAESYPPPAPERVFTGEQLEDWKRIQAKRKKKTP